MHRLAVSVLLVLALSGAGYAAVVTLPDESQTTTFTANVSEQANVTVPANVSWTVDSIASPTASAAQTVSATAVVLDDGSKLRIEIAPDATDFTPPANGTVTWASSAISWVGTWTNGTANDATMSATANTYVKVVDMTAANAASVSSADLVFTLAAKAGVDRAGAHTLSATWKFSSF
jgi:hypothetical protein